MGHLAEMQGCGRTLLIMVMEIYVVETAIPDDMNMLGVFRQFLRY